MLQLVNLESDDNNVSITLYDVMMSDYCLGTCCIFPDKCD